MSISKRAGAASGFRLALLNGSYQSLTNLYYLVVRGIYIVAFARLLGVEQYGHYVYSQAWYVMALAIATWGMSELAIAEYSREKPADGTQLLASGFSLRLIFSAIMSMVIIFAALLFEPNSNLRLLIIIYAQGVIVRGASGWFSAMFIARESSQYWLYLSVPFLTLEVLLAIYLALSGYSLVSIAVLQCTLWWLMLFTAWYVYSRAFGPFFPGLTSRYVDFFVRNGPTLALSAFILTCMGSGLLVACRYFLGSGQQLGEAAFVVQILVILGQMIKVASNTALPQLNKLVSNRNQRQIFYVSTVWQQSIYLGGVAFILCYLAIPQLVVNLAGEEFKGAADLFASICWVLIPLLIIYGLRLMLICNRKMSGFLLAILFGLLLLLAQLFVFASYNILSVTNLFVALGLAYCACALVVLGMVRRSLTGLSLRSLFNAPLVLAVCLAVYFFTLRFSAVLAVTLAAVPLIVAAICEFNSAYKRILSP